MSALGMLAIGIGSLSIVLLALCAYVGLRLWWAKDEYGEDAEL